MSRHSHPHPKMLARLLVGGHMPTANADRQAAAVLRSRRVRPAAAQRRQRSRTKQPVCESPVAARLSPLQMPTVLPSEALAIRQVEIPQGSAPGGPKRWEELRGDGGSARGQRRPGGESGQPSSARAIRRPQSARLWLALALLRMRGFL
jgi:hypothetical protein